jgi:hypothetical protein
MLTVFLSGNEGVSTLNIKLGTQYDADDVMNTTYTVGTNITIADNMLQVPLSISAGQYFVAVTITRSDASTHLMEYQFQ